MVDMNVLTVGAKIINDQDKIFIMRYASSRNWTIPNAVINCEKNEENDTTYLNGAFQLIPAGVNLISLNKIVDCENKESIRSDNEGDDNSISVVHHSVIFEARVEMTEDYSLLDVPLKFDYMQWVPQDSLISVPFTNRITQKLVEYNKLDPLLPMVLSGIM